MPRDAYYQRTDLQLSGRTVMGMDAPRGQERCHLVHTTTTADHLLLLLLHLTPTTYFYCSFLLPSYLPPTTHC